MTPTTLILVAALLGGGSPRQSVRVHRADSSRSCVAASRTGTFRITMKNGASAVGAPAILMLESIDGCLEATYVTDESSPVIIDHLMLSDRELRGVMPTSNGQAKVSFEFDGSSVNGRIEQGGKTWSVEGRKTS